MNLFNATKKAAAMLGVAVGVVFVSGAVAQGVDTAYVPFRVNVAANILAEYKSGSSVIASAQTSAPAVTDVTLAVPLPEGTATGVLFGTPRRSSHLVVSGNGGGKVSLNLPAQSYKNARVALYGINGKRVLSAKFSASQAVNSVSRRNVVAGVYLLSIKGSDAAASVTSRVTHRGGSLEINAAFGGDNLSSVPQLAKKTAAGDWTITVTAPERADLVYTLKLTSGINPKQNITMSVSGSSVESGPAIPSNVTATVASSSSITVGWSSVAGATVYRVYRAASESGTYTLIGTSQTASYTNTGLSRGTAYYYKVSAFNSVGEGAQSSVVFAMISELDAPIGVTAAAALSNGITVSWSAVAGADVYNVYRSTSATGSYTLAGTSTSASYTNSGLTVGTTYYYKVSAYNNTGESVQSSAVSAKVFELGTITDARDNKTYLTVKIGNQTWMKENLNYQPVTGSSWCYGGDNSNCAKYGRLYDWSTAMDIEEIYNGNVWGGGDTKHQGVCPSEWHLPSRVEWGTLAKAAGGTGDYGAGGTAGTKLKSTSGWNSSGNGTDEFGFSALPGGYRNSGGSFSNVGGYGVWWTATEYGGGAYNRGMGYDNDYVYEYSNYKENGFSVRCLRD